MTATETAPKTYTRDLAAFAREMQLGDVPAEATHEALRILIDCVGCGVAGLVAPGTRIAIDLARGEHGPLEANVIGGGEASVLPACYANTTAMNSLDFDVYGPEAHLSPVVVSAALAIGDAVRATGADVLAAMCAGLEVGGRVGAALRRAGMGGGEHEIGAVRGEGNVVFGAAVAAGRLLGLDGEQMHHALGIAGYSATVPTMRKFLGSNLPFTKYDHLALMTQNGVQAALLAQRGFTGDLEVLEGEDIGFWRFAGAKGCDWDALTGGLGSHWLLPEVTYKHYPAVLYTNSAIHEAQRLLRENQLSPEEIDGVEMRSSRSSGDPRRAKPTHYLSAWGNSAYTIAAGVFDVRPLRSWEQPQVFQRPDILALMEKVRFGPLREGEVTSEGNYWERWAPVRVTIEARGRTFEGGRDYHLPMDDAALVAKLRDNVGGLISEDAAQRLERACWVLESLSRASELTALLAEADPSKAEPA
jgi:2-methylcitrate dehydratase PrpD